MTTDGGPRPMRFKVRPVSGGADGWHWTVYSCPDLAFLRDGQVAGDRDGAERAARAAIASMGGVVEPPAPG